MNTCTLCGGKMIPLFTTLTCSQCPSEVLSLVKSSEMGFLVISRSEWMNKSYGKGIILNDLSIAKAAAQNLKNIAKKNYLVIRVKSESGPIAFDEDGSSSKGYIVKKKSNKNPWDKATYRAREESIICEV